MVRHNVRTKIPPLIVWRDVGCPTKRKMKVDKSIVVKMVTVYTVIGFLLVFVKRRRFQITVPIRYLKN